MDSNTDEPARPAFFDLPDGDASESKRYPDRPLHVLLATTGSVASIKAPLIVSELLNVYQNIEVQVVATGASLHFYDAERLQHSSKASGKSVRVWKDADEWDNWTYVGDPILHIELRRWADVVLVAPLSANTLAKLCHGICDNLFTSLMRALDTKRTKVFVFPAMNTFMYDHPLTQPQLDILRNVLGYTVVGPIGKVLACGDVGLGAMTEWMDIVQLVVDSFKLQK